MLHHTSAARFAPRFHSPLREQRELFFAQGQNQGSNKSEQGKIETGPELGTGSSLSELTRGQRSLLLSAVPTVELEKYRESQNVQDALALVEMPAGTNNADRKKQQAIIDNQPQNLAKSLENSVRNAEQCSEATGELLRDPEVLRRTITVMDEEADRLKNAEILLNTMPKPLIERMELILELNEQASNANAGISDELTKKSHRLYKTIHGEMLPVFQSYTEAVNADRARNGLPALTLPSFENDPKGALAYIQRLFLSVYGNVATTRKQSRERRTALESQSSALKNILDSHLQSEVRATIDALTKNTAASLVISDAELLALARQSKLNGDELDAIKRSPQATTGVTKEAFEKIENRLGMPPNSLKLLRNADELAKALASPKQEQLSIQLVEGFDDFTVSTRGYSAVAVLTKLHEDLEDLRLHGRAPTKPRPGKASPARANEAGFLSDAVVTMAILRETAEKNVDNTREQEATREAMQWQRDIKKRYETIATAPELSGKSKRALDGIGRQLEMIGSAPLTSLNPTAKQKGQIEQMLVLLEKEVQVPGIFEAAFEKNDQEQGILTAVEGPRAKIAEVMAETRGKLDTVLGRIAPAENQTSAGRRNRKLKAPLTHEVLRSGPINLLSTINEIDVGVQTVSSSVTEKVQSEMTDEDIRRLTNEVVWASGKVRELEKFEQTLEPLRNREKLVRYENRPSELWDAKYDRKDGTITINTHFIDPQDSVTIQDKVEHEIGHLLLHALETSGLMPVLSETVYDTYKTRTYNGSDAALRGKTFESLVKQLLLTHPQYSGYKELDQRERRSAVVEELINRRADYLRGSTAVRKQAYTAEEKAAFEILDQSDTPETATLPTFTMPAGEDRDVRRQLQSARNAGVRFSSHADPHAGGHADHGEHGGHGDHGEHGGHDDTESGTMDVKAALDEMRRMIYKIRSFEHAYRGKLPSSTAGGIANKAEIFGKNLDDLRKMFEDPHERAQFEGGRPEEDKAFQDTVRDCSDDVKRLYNKIQNFDVEALDTSDAKPSLMKGLLSGITFLSINDITKFVSDTMEDWSSMYQRNQDAKLKKFGKVVTKSLLEAPVGWMGSYGKYVNGLYSYHERRYSGTDEEAAHKWKDGMKNLDTHYLIHILHHTKNTDAVRGIIELLCDRGEMDWNDTGVWKQLMKLSGYTMPIEPCQRDDVLRDIWLRKMITAIYEDRELYYHMRATNDDKIKSGKGHFTATVDQLMNLPGAATGELKKMLKLKDKHPHDPPEDVKPHLYEEIIHYAIRNGKLSMEDKFYYLVQGIACGILSVDRLRTLAGEEGGVLNAFPFIDYFYKKNNTLPEIISLAKRLEEPGKSFTPGAKTTLWLHLEVARNESVQQRVRKGTSKSNAENIDHEDVPFFVPQLGLEERRNVLDIISGSRQKMSPEALKNLYCGDSSTLKVGGLLAIMDESGRDRFTGNDAGRLIRQMVNYMDFDNIVTRNGYDKDTRPILGKDAFDSQAPSSDGHTVNQYRKRNNQLVTQVMMQYKDRIMAHRNWGRVVGKEATLKEDIEISFDDLLPRAEHREVTQSMAQKIFRSIPMLQSILYDIVSTDFEDFKQILKSFAEGKNELYDEGGSAGQMTRANVIEYYEKRKNSGAKIEFDYYAGHGHH